MTTFTNVLPYLEEVNRGTQDSYLYVEYRVLPAYYITYNNKHVRHIFKDDRLDLYYVSVMHDNGSIAVTSVNLEGWKVFQVTEINFE